MGVPHAGQKRSRPGDAAQKRRDDFQLDFLAALRVIENLGTDSPTVHDNIRSLRDPPLLSVLNFISLIVETDSTRLNRSDIAVAVSADPGQLQLLLVKANGQTPTDGECTNLASFVQTLRDSLRDDHRNEVLITKRFMNLISQRHYPELSRKLSRIGTLGGKTPKQNWARFTSLLPLWQRAYPMGERSHGFVKLAQEIHGAVHEEYAAENLMIDEIRRFILHDHAQPQAMDDMSPKARYYLTEFALESSMRLIHSNFFRDVIRQGRFRNMLNEDEEDHIFLFEMFRRINDVARYLQGLRHFVQEGITYIVKALGPEGLERFLSCTGGIIPRWVVHRRRYRPRTLFWGTHPEDKVRRLLTSGHVATYTHDASECDRMSQEAEVISLWSKGAPVTPVLHPEIELIRHLENAHLTILDGSIGMNQPPCWPCFVYMRLLRRFENSRWRMSPTTGRPRGPWMIPRACHPSLRDSMMYRVESRVYHAVEEYGFDWQELWAYADDVRAKEPGHAPEIQ